MEGIILFLVLMIPAFYFYADNQAYLKMNLIQEETTNYFNVLVANIKGCDGYTDDMPIVFRGGAIQDNTLHTVAIQSTTYTGYEYSFSDMLNDYTWLQYMILHTGFSPSIDWDASWTYSNEEVENMPCYPDSGSIRVVENKVVVKFAQ